MRPSYDLKLDRAEKHLIELECAVKRYVSGHPYAVSVSIEAKKNRVVHRFRFTEQPDPMISLIVGDFVYNIRSALDHLRTALVPKARERNGYFPIHFPGVWEPAIPGENEKRTKERNAWNTETLGMRPEAVAILQRLQEEADSDEIDRPPALTAINRIAVKDRHTKIAVVASALLNPSGICRGADGLTHTLSSLPPLEGVRDGAYLNVPEGAMDVKIEGTPAVMVRITSQENGIRIPQVLREVILPGTRQVVDMLRPYVLRMT